MKLFLFCMLCLPAFGAMRVQSPITITKSSVTLHLPLTISRLTVTITPTASSINFVEQVNLVAKVSGGKPPQNKAGVTWAFPSSGRLINTTPTSATYIPPPQACGTALVGASAKSDPSKTGIAAVTVTQVSPLAVIPAVVNLAPGQQQLFTATGGCPAKF